MTHEFDTRTFPSGELITTLEKKFQDRSVDQIRIRVTTDLEADSISRFLHTQGFEVGVDSMGMDTWVEGHRSPVETNQHPKECPGQAIEDALVLITSPSLGPMSDPLGQDLMTRFLATLAQRPCPPAVIALVHQGVHLSEKKSQAGSSFQTLTDRGVDLLVCRTSADHAGVSPERGKIVPFERIAEAILAAAKVTRL